MALDSGSYTRSAPPVTDTVQSLSATASNAQNGTVITYTTTVAHNLVPGQVVVTKGFTPATYPWLQFDPDTSVGNANPAVVASVPSSTTFTVKYPSVIATAASSISGTVIQSAKVDVAPWSENWLPTTSQQNVVVAREWGASFPIQPNYESNAGDLRTVPVALNGNPTNTTGQQVSYPVASHSFTAGQFINIQGVAPDTYNYEGIQIAATTSTSITVNSTNTAPVTSTAYAGIVAQLRLNGSQAKISSATGPVGATAPTQTTNSSTGAISTTVATINVTSTTNPALAVGMGVTSGSVFATGTVVTAIGSGTITVNPLPIATAVAGTTLTFSGSTSNQYTTALPHNLTTGQTIAVRGSVNANYNTTGLVTVVNPTVFSLPAPSFRIVKVSKTDGTGSVGDGTNVLYYTDSAHNLAAGDKVSVYGVNGAANATGYNVNNATVAASPAPTGSTFALTNSTTTAFTGAGFAIEGSTTFTAPAYVSLGDNGWSSTYVSPSGYLVTSLDNHDRVTNSDSGYPAFAPGIVVPDIRGLTTTNALQKLRATGLQPGTVSFGVGTAISSVTAVSSNSTTVTVASTSGVYVGMGVTGTASVTAAIASTNYVSAIGSGTVTLNATTTTTIATSTPILFTTDMFGATVATSPSYIKVTTLAAHYLAVGDTVNLSGSSNTQLNVGDIVVAPTPVGAATPSSTEFYLLIAGVTSATATGLVIRAKNTVVTAQSPLAGATIADGSAKSVFITRNYGL